MSQYDTPSDYLYESMIKRALGFISQIELLRIDAFLRRTQPDFGDQWPKLLARLHSHFLQFSGNKLEGGLFDGEIIDQSPDATSSPDTMASDSRDDTINSEFSTDTMTDEAIPPCICFDPKPTTKRRFADISI